MKRSMGVVLAVATIAIATAGTAYADSFTENKGGGVWVHGTSYSFPATKNAWSNYYHRDKTHSATVVGANGDRKFAKVERDAWANTEIHVGLSDPVHAYWNVY